MNRKEYCRKYYKKYREKYRWYNHYSISKQRCNNPKNPSFKNYGGKGIKFLMTVKDFKFLWFRNKAYLMKKPSIDRKDNNGDYTLKNCRFIELGKNISKDRKGEKCHLSKLTETQIKKIRKIYTKGNIFQRELAKKFDISRRNIGKIINYKTWKHI